MPVTRGKHQQLSSPLAYATRHGELAMPVRTRANSYQDEATTWLITKQCDGKGSTRVRRAYRDVVGQEGRVVPSAPVAHFVEQVAGWSA